MEKCFLICLYKSPSSSHDELETPCSNFNLFIDNLNTNQPSCLIVIKDFNVKCSNWCSDDKTNKASLESETLTKTVGYSRL